MTTVGIARDARAVRPGLDQAGLDVRRQARRLEGRPRDVSEADRPVGSGDCEAAVAEFDIVGGGFEHMRRDALPLVDDLVGRDQQRGAAHRGDARTAGAEPEGEAIGVALHELDFLRLQTQPVAQQLCEGGRMPLALRGRAAKNGHAPRRSEPDLGEFEAGRSGALDGVGDAQPEQLPVLRGVAPPVLEAPGFGERERPVHVGLEIARVVDEAERG